MPVFKDAADREWSLKFDGLLLGDLRDALGIDLADVTGDTYARLYADPVLLTRAVAFLCGEQLQKQGLTDRQLALHLTGEALDRAFSCLWETAKLFFPPKLWSALESCFSQRRMLAEMTPLLEMLKRPEIPEAIREAMAAQIAAQIAPSVSPNSPAADGSATGPVAIPSNSAYDSPATAESTPAA